MIIYFTNKDTLRRILSEKVGFRCAWCHRWKIGDQWFDEKDLPPDTQFDVRPSDGICPDCEAVHAEKYRKEIEELNKTSPLI